ncbi:hypothetical protein [Gordonia sp. (in: high G+C Gram-positive bacteria)]|uniref:hypothetical protein n=1 Tax=Gordonia sp. (in: high G+C Gram-positive bacteria) TaxID=84139 RepID=UPI0019AC3B28|nr:hypothetical protein [Gordonia sp. (in: high G+C Gram-positive bacteria)]
MAGPPPQTPQGCVVRAVCPRPTPLPGAIIGNIVHEGIRCGAYTVDNPDEAVPAISSLCGDVCRWFPSRTRSDPAAVGADSAGLALRMVR